MNQIRNLMGMHITVEVVDPQVQASDIEKIYAYFRYIDDTFSTYKESSEISLINAGKLSKSQYSKDMQEILRLCEQTKKETNGYFDIEHLNQLDPSGLVKGWAIWQASKLFDKAGFSNYYIDAGGDVQVSGKTWTVGIRNPFNYNEVIKIVSLNNLGIATSGTAERGQHIYIPQKPKAQISNIVSLTVIGPNVYEADRFATAAFAMEKQGIQFIEKLPGFEGYMIDKNGLATFTSGFAKYTQSI